MAETSHKPTYMYIDEDKGEQEGKELEAGDCDEREKNQRIIMCWTE